MVMCPKQEQNANWSQVEIEKLIVRGRNLPSTNSTKCETQNIFAKKQQNEHTPGVTFFKFHKQFKVLTSYIIWIIDLEKDDQLSSLKKQRATQHDSFLHK